MMERLYRMDDAQRRDFLAALCDRIAAQDDGLRIFVPGTFRRERIMAQWERLLVRYPTPEKRPPLFGVPVGIKDIFHCTDFVTRCGSDLPPHLFQGPEAAAVARLKAAGAIVMGKTATTEFAYFAPADTRNPVNPDHTPGGSSSGSAAGVAAGFFTYALGSQTVGSVIRPAAYCGIAGFKPSLGRIDTSGMVPFSATVDHVGVFGPALSALPPVLQVLCDAWKETPLPEVLRLGIPVGAYLEQAQSEALGVFDRQVDRLAAAGCDIVRIPFFKDIEAINERHSDLIAGEMARFHGSWFEEHKTLYREATRQMIVMGLDVADEALPSLRDSCLQLRRDITAALAAHDLDAWICPAAPGEAPRGLDSTGSPCMNLPWTHAGLPAATIPAGRGPNGLPLGLQIVGAFMADEHLTALASVLEARLQQG
jgi:Asp-tRNA(Asn)/Glu-tRNA(Gln) amidotransferase A subunit family amidase